VASIIIAVVRSIRQLISLRSAWSDCIYFERLLSVCILLTIRTQKVRMSKRTVKQSTLGCYSCCIIKHGTDLYGDRHRERGTCTNENGCRKVAISHKDAFTAYNPYKT